MSTLLNRFTLPGVLLLSAALLPGAVAQEAPKAQAQSIVVAAAGPAVTGLTLINADTSQPVPGYDPIPAGAVLDLSKLPRNLNVRANTSGQIGSVRFRQAGMADRVESGAPYSLCSDTKGKYFTCAPSVLAVGQHSLSATPYSKAGGAGTAGTGVLLSFTVVPKVQAAAPAPVTVSGLTLINADTNQPVAGFDPVPAGATLKLSALPANINVRVQTSAGVRSVSFVVDGKPLRTENQRPFALCGDVKDKYGKKGDYAACGANVFAAGNHTVIFTPHSEMFGKGTAGSAVTWTYTIER